MGEEVLSWLLEKENPSVRYLTMRHLLDMKEKDSEVAETRKAIPEMRQVRHIFEKQGRGGFWGKRDSPYQPRYKATYWTLMLLARLGLGRDHRIQDACEYLFGFQKEHGGFFPSEADVPAIPCLTGNVLCLLHRFGYGRDRRARKALEHLCRTQMPDGGWVCHEWKSHARDRHGCFQGTISPLEAMMLFGKRKEAGRAAEFFLMHRMYMADHHDNRTIKPHFLLLGFPTFFYSILRGLRVLTEMGVRDARMTDALDVLVSKRGGNGRWVAESVPNLLSTFDEKGCESKWVTGEAMHILKQWADDSF